MDCKDCPYCTFDENNVPICHFDKWSTDDIAPCEED